MLEFEFKSARLQAWVTSVHLAWVTSVHLVCSILPRFSLRKVPFTQWKPWQNLVLQKQLQSIVLLHVTQAPNIFVRRNLCCKTEKTVINYLQASWENHFNGNVFRNQGLYAKHLLEKSVVRKQKKLSLIIYQLPGKPISTERSLETVAELAFSTKVFSRRLSWIIDELNKG